jgi:hypothetical protein
VAVNGSTIRPDEAGVGGCAEPTAETAAPLAATVGCTGSGIEGEATTRPLPEGSARIASSTACRASEDMAGPAISGDGRGCKLDDGGDGTIMAPSRKKALVSRPGSGSIRRESARIAAATSWRAAMARPGIVRSTRESSIPVATGGAVTAETAGSASAAMAGEGDETTGAARLSLDNRTMWVPAELADCGTGIRNSTAASAMCSATETAAAKPQSDLSTAAVIRSPRPVAGWHGA